MVREGIRDAKKADVTRETRMGMKRDEDRDIVSLYVW